MARFTRKGGSKKRFTRRRFTLGKIKKKQSSSFVDRHFSKRRNTYRRQMSGSFRTDREGPIPTAFKYGMGAYSARKVGQLIDTAVFTPSKLLKTYRPFTNNVVKATKYVGGMLPSSVIGAAEYIPYLLGMASAHPYVAATVAGLGGAYMFPDLFMPHPDVARRFNEHVVPTVQNVVDATLSAPGKAVDAVKNVATKAFDTFNNMIKEDGKKARADRLKYHIDNRDRKLSQLETQMKEIRALRSQQVKPVDSVQQILSGMSGDTSSNRPQLPPPTNNPQLPPPGREPGMEEPHQIRVRSQYDLDREYHPEGWDVDGVWHFPSDGHWHTDESERERRGEELRRLHPNAGVRFVDGEWHWHYDGHHYTHPSHRGWDWLQPDEL